MNPFQELESLADSVRMQARESILENFNRVNGPCCLCGSRSSKLIHDGEKLNAVCEECYQDFLRWKEK